jgi:hypothetical protein
MMLGGTFMEVVMRGEEEGKVAEGICSPRSESAKARNTQGLTCRLFEPNAERKLRN